MVRTARCKQDLSPENRFLRFFDLSEWNRILRSKTMRDVYEPKTETQSRLAFECREYSLGWIAVAVRHKAIKPQMKHSRFFSIGCRKNADSKYLWYEINEIFVNVTAPSRFYNNNKLFFK